jgi:hypothetical protein
VIEPDDVTVELRLVAKPDSKLKAFADVTVNLGEVGEFTTFGWSVLGDPIRVVPPARKGEQRFFDVVAMTGKLKTIVYTLIGNAYKAELRKRSEVSK